MPFHMGAGELAIIFAIVILLFGAGRISGLGASLGKGIRMFRKEISEEGKEKEEDKS